MAQITRFEDIKAWQVARELTRLIYVLSNKGLFARDFGLRDQIRRAVVSIMSNIAEGFGRGGDKEFIQFLSTARGSVAEVKSQLYVALDLGYVAPVEFGQMYEMADMISRLIGGLIGYLQRNDYEFKGSKFKQS